LWSSAISDIFFNETSARSFASRDEDDDEETDDEEDEEEEGVEEDDPPVALLLLISVSNFANRSLDPMDDDDDETPASYFFSLDSTFDSPKEGSSKRVTNFAMEVSIANSRVSMLAIAAGGWADPPEDGREPDDEDDDDIDDDDDDNDDQDALENDDEDEEDDDEEDDEDDAVSNISSKHGLQRSYDVFAFTQVLHE